MAHGHHCQGHEGVGPEEGKGQQSTGENGDREPRPGAEGPGREEPDPVSALEPDGAHPALGIGVRSRAARRDLHHFDPGAGKHCVERLGELPGRGRGSGTCCDTRSHVVSELVEEVGLMPVT